MVWGVHGIHLAHHGTSLSEMGHFQLLKHAPGESRYRQMLWLGKQPLQQPAMSPCGAFVCLYAPERGCIKVVDVRSGRTVLRHPLGPMQAQLDFELCSAINIWWCNQHLVEQLRACLLVRICVFDKRPGSQSRWAYERIHLLQF